MTSLTDFCHNYHVTPSSNKRRTLLTTVRSPGVRSYGLLQQSHQTLPMLLFLTFFCVSISGVRPLIGYDR